ncbi:nuclease-related domain-containing protein [Ureibacillus thermophilus]|uniref:nuclease-related domain-containing protein n=1 Tax=Ureibacillus thermophilus TaxID=367743 RepID=UPI00360D19AF
MAILFLTIFIVIGILFAFRVYTYENSEFRKITGYSLFTVLTNLHIKNTYLLVQSLKYLQGEYKLLLNLAFPTMDGKRILDAMVIHESGIYVFNIQHKNGWIYGREQDDQWVQATDKKINCCHSLIRLLRRKN